MNGNVLNVKKTNGATNNRFRSHCAEQRKEIMKVERLAKMMKQNQERKKSKKNENEKERENVDQRKRATLRTRYVLREGYRLVIDFIYNFLSLSL